MLCQKHCKIQCLLTLSETCLKLCMKLVWNCSETLHNIASLWTAPCPDFAPTHTLWINLSHNFVVLRRSLLPPSLGLSPIHASPLCNHIPQAPSTHTWSSTYAHSPINLQIQSVTTCPRPGSISKTCTNFVPFQDWRVHDLPTSICQCVPKHYTCCQCALGGLHIPCSYALSMTW